MNSHPQIQLKSCFQARIDHIKMQMEILANEPMAILMLRDELQWLEDQLEMI